MSPFEGSVPEVALKLLAFAVADNLDDFDSDSEEIDDVDGDSRWAEQLVAAVDQYCKFNWQRDIPSDVAEFIRATIAPPRGGES